MSKKNGWAENGNGTDEFGFSALPGGTFESELGDYGIGVTGFWWSATEVTDENEAYYRGMGSSHDHAEQLKEIKGLVALSVRCIKD
jgi:uncharacterized protein (TIGR02145 family)